jgi:hypothetical protein
MDENVPCWTASVFERDRKLERFRRALEVIADLEPQVDGLARDQALVVLRRVTTAARVALEQ